MIGAVSSSSAAPLRPIMTSLASCGCGTCMACAPQRVLASPAAPIALSAPAASPSLNVTANEGAKISVNESSKSDSATTGTGLPKTKDAKKPDSGQETTKTSTGKELTQEQQAQLAKLKARDREVRAHEQAHAAAGGALAGAPSYSYQTGPDGKQYAVGGEVPIRATASSGNPRQAIAQLQQVARAATAPASPSGQDRAVAAQARQQIAQLQAQLAQEAQAKAQEALKGPSSEDTSKSEAAEKPVGLPKLPELPEIAAPRGRTSNAPPAGLAQSGATPKGIGASDANPLGPNPSGRGGVSALVRSANPSDDAPSIGGPIEVANRNAGPIAAYQQSGGPSKPASIVGRIVSLNA